MYLILTLNQCYPDYDFSQLRARHFRKEESATDVEGVVDSHLLSVSKVCCHTTAGIQCAPPEHVSAFASAGMGAEPQIRRQQVPGWLVVCNR